MVLCSVFRFFGVDGATADDIQNMGDEHFAIGLSYMDFFFKVAMHNAFVVEGWSTVNTSLIVIVDGCGSGGVRHAKIGSDEANHKKFFDTFICFNGFSLTGVLSWLGLTNWFPWNSPTAVADDITQDGEEI